MNYFEQTVIKQKKTAVTGFRKPYDRSFTIYLQNLENNSKPNTSALDSWETSLSQHAFSVEKVRLWSRMMRMRTRQATSPKTHFRTSVHQRNQLYQAKETPTKGGCLYNTHTL